MDISFKEKMSQEIADWQNVGLIDSDQTSLLHQRYDPQEFKSTLILKWLGLFSIFMLGISFLGFIGTIMASFSPLFSTLCLMVMAGFIILYGVKLASDKQQKYSFTGQSLLTAGLIGVYASLVSIYFVFDGDAYREVNPFFMLITSGVAFITAYKFHLRWPLLIALLMFFHGVGSMSQYWGNGSYFLSVQDPRSMSVIALLVIIWGVWHEQEMEVNKLRRCIGFGHLYIIFGLLYLNLSLWILSLDRGELVWIIIFSIVCIAQVISGARLKDSRFTGFGIVFLSIDLYTRFYEYFWDSLSKAMFFSLAGAAAMIFGYLCERQTNRDETS